MIPKSDDQSSATQTDWVRLRTQSDADIARAVAADPDAAAIVTADELRQFDVVPPRHRR